MSRILSFSRSSQAGRRRTKAMLLPIPRAVADELALQVHLALAALRSERGTRHDARTLLQTLVVAVSLADGGYGALTPDAVRAAEDAIDACFARGREADVWRLPEPAFAAFSAIVAAYDGQLQSAPMWALAEANAQLDRVGAAERNAAQRKHA